MEEGEYLNPQTPAFDFAGPTWLSAMPFYSRWPMNWLRLEMLYGMSEPMLVSLPSRLRTAPVKEAK